MEESAYLTDLLAGPAAARAGIVFTGAARRADNERSDGPANLAGAIAVAAHSAARGAGAVVSFGGEVHAARWAAYDGRGFTSEPYRPIARITGDRIIELGAPPPRPPAPTGQPATEIALIKTYPGMEDVLLRAAVDGGAAGVVLEGTGAGNVPGGLFAAITDLTEWGVPVVIASRCGGAGPPSAVPPSAVPPPVGPPPVGLPPVGPPLPGAAGVGSSGADLERAGGLALSMGAIGARGLSASKARVALMVALGAGSADGARRWFDRL
jgi:L-asparaginase